MSEFDRPDARGPIYVPRHGGDWRWMLLSPTAWFFIAVQAVVLMLAGFSAALWMISI